MHATAAGLYSLAIASGLAATMLIAWLAGWMVGQAERRKYGQYQTVMLDRASMAMLSLLLAFSFGSSLQKHQQRQDNVVSDANAIANMYIASATLPSPQRDPVRKVLRQITELRLRIAQDTETPAEFDTALAETRQLQSDMFASIAESFNARPIPPSAVTGLQGVFDASNVRLAGYRARLPESIIALLFVASILTAFLMGREAEHFRETLGMVCLIFIVAFTVGVTVDLNLRSGGFIAVDQEAIENVLTMMSS